MRSQRTKDLYYCTFGRLSVVSLLWHRCRGRGRYHGSVVHLGCGPKYLFGMVNVDGNIFRRKDIWLDITLGLPFADNSIRAFYASHIFEHFEIEQLRRVLSETHRALQPGGVLRMVVPSLEFAVEAYRAGRLEDLPAWPDGFRSIGGRFNNLMLCQGQHRLMLDFSFLEELLADAGFASIQRAAPLESRFFRPQQLECEKDPALAGKSLHIECAKP